MEILILVLLYYLSQNPDFTESVKPLMAKLKDSEQMLSFLKDLSNFSQTFSTFASPKKDCEQNTQQSEKQEKTDNNKEKSPQSPTAGIADDFIQKILDGYLKKR